MPTPYSGAAVPSPPATGRPAAPRCNRDGLALISAEVPLAETFGYATDLRSMTQGQGTFTMELLCYRRVPASIQEEIIKKKKEGGQAGAR